MWHVSCVFQIELLAKELENGYKIEDDETMIEVCLPVLCMPLYTTLYMYSLPLILYSIQQMMRGNTRTLNVSIVMTRLD